MRLIRFFTKATCFIVLFHVFLVTSCSASPYQTSTVITGITFDWSTHIRRAPGSDNWPITWADDDHQYTSWGDGGGFGGTNSAGRVSLGVARVVGSTADSYTGYNVWGGLNPENPATFSGKSYGIISIDGILYMWVTKGTNIEGYEEARLYSSNDKGASWTPANWVFTDADGITAPTFVQFGKDYQNARDSYVYVFANHIKDTSALKVQKPGEIALIRVPKDQMTIRVAYQFFTGLDVSGNPIWTDDITVRVPAFYDPEGVGWNTSVSYNIPLRRYLLITEHTETFKGNIGIFEAPEPWGPWSTVLYEDGFGAGFIVTNTFFWNFSNKWLSPDGKNFTLIFTGIGITTNDSWNSVQGEFILNTVPDNIAPSPPANLRDENL